MSPDESERRNRIDRLIEFLANQQAELTSKMDRNEANFKRHEVNFKRIEEKQRENAKQIGQNTKLIRELSNFLLRLGKVVEVQGERLDTVVAIFERHLAHGGHN